jgi:membrane protease YdiL (CAAX protease family)
MATDVAPPGPARPQTPEDELAAKLRGFGPIGILAILVVLAGNFLFPPLSALLALGWAQWSRTPWRELGFKRPPSWFGGAALGVALGVTLKLVMKAIVMPLLGADPVNHTYHYLAGNSAALPGMVLMLVVVAGFGEETLFRGYLFERLGRLFGRGAGGTLLTIALTSALFGIEHLSDQGVPGAQQATITGLITASIFARTRSLWMLMWLHTAFDLAAVWIIYSGREIQIAHWFFR